MTQKEKIAFQGHAGAYSDMACRSVFPALETLPCGSFDEAFAAVREGGASLAMIPVDNTIAGRVADVHHLLPRGGLYIVGEHFQPIRHALLGVKGAKIGDVRDVYSHVHAIPQCRAMIRKYGLTSHVCTDTAGAALLVAEKADRAHAAIASPLAAAIYGLAILAEDIQDESHNTTRFLILAGQPAPLPPYEEGAPPVITSMIYTVRNIPAALYKSLGGFATNGISMAKLESYVGEGFGVARFYAEVEGHPDSPAMRHAMEELSFFASEVSVLGAYPAHPSRFGKERA